MLLSHLSRGPASHMASCPPEAIHPPRPVYATSSATGAPGPGLRTPEGGSAEPPPWPTRPSAVAAPRTWHNFVFGCCIQAGRAWCGGEGEAGWGGTHVMHGRSRKITDPRTPTMPGRSTSGFHPPGRHCSQRARSAVRCSSWAGRIKGELQEGVVGQPTDHIKHFQITKRHAAVRASSPCRAQADNTAVLPFSYPPFGDVRARSIAPGWPKSSSIPGSLKYGY